MGSKFVKEGVRRTTKMNSSIAFPNGDNHNKNGMIPGDLIELARSWSGDRVDLKGF